MRRFSKPCIFLPKAAAEPHPTTHYIWRTSSDGQVRPSHAANNGKIFAWNNAPATGHPGEAHHCRCTAEPYEGDIPPALLQDFRNSLLDYLARTHPWGNIEMSLYFFIGNGETVTLESIGHAEMIRDYYIRHYLGRFEEQIQKNAALSPAGSFQDDFNATYNFREILYSYRDARVRGYCMGEIGQTPNGKRMLSGKISFLFDDHFKDPINIAQAYVMLRDKLSFAEHIRETELSETFRSIADLWQKPYKITGGWEIDHTTIIP